MHRAVDGVLILLEFFQQMTNVSLNLLGDVQLRLELAEGPQRRVPGLPRFPRVKRLQRPTARPCAFLHLSASFRIPSSTSTISSAVSAASQPLLPSRPPARASAC